MKYISQITIILLVSFLGELLQAVVPLPVPASIYGMVLMLLGLCTGIIPLEKVDDAGSFLVEIMPVMFIPAGVGLIASWDDLRPMLLPALVAVLPLTAVVMAASGRVAQAVIDLENRRRAK